MSALRTGERMAGGGAIALLLLLCLDWFALDVPLALPGLHRTGWASLGWLMIVLLLAVVVMVGAQIVATARAGLEQQLRAGVATTAMSTLVAPILILRVVLFQPGLGVGAPNAAVSVLAPAYLGILAELLIAAGAWYALADERTDARQSAYEPPAPRPAPPSA